MLSVARGLCLLLVFLALPASGAAEEAPRLVVDRWLVLGPETHPWPAFHEDATGGFDLEKLLEAQVLSPSLERPAADAAVGWFSGDARRWTSRWVGEGETLALERPMGDAADHPAVAWLAAYVTTRRWHSLTLELPGTHPRRVWLDGEAVLKGGLDADEEQDEPEKSIELTSGKHLLVVETVLEPERDAEWQVGVALRAAEDASLEADVTLDPARSVELRDITDAPSISSLAVSPDGLQVVTSVTRVVPGTHDSESWIEVRATDDGRLLDSWRGATGAGQVAWSPDGRYISWVASVSAEKKTSTLFLWDLETNRTTPLLERVERLAGYVWSPSVRMLVYATETEGKAFEKGVKLLRGPRDRMANFRDRQTLHLVAVPGGTRRRLTAGAESSYATGFSPDGRRLLFTRLFDALETRPYTRTELWEMDLETFEARKLRDFRQLRDARYGPDGRTILISTHADEFGRAGVDVPEGAIANSYDGQLFIWDPASDEARAITRDFDPAVTSAWWSWVDGRIYVVAEDRDYRRLYRYDPDGGAFDAIDTGVDVFRDHDFAARVPRLVAVGSSAWSPQALLTVDLDRDRATRLEHPADDWFAEVEQPGGLETWSFLASSGNTIDGRVYLPPGFDSRRKYPMIVYYYGGTSPVNRSFGGRYPKEWWASHGYVVYVMQPSGATGFGQEFSARHVNDWGKTTSEEIIEGTRAFLELNDYVDPERVGCIGASYGGFMTMLLATKTDLFAAAVSHAGISSLASYWGEGYWGYNYGAVASADAFPWNRRDVYVDQSPLFRADQAQVPILLTHGVDDTNVPKGESDQFYLALKLLGKTVEYLQVEGQDHWILDHEKRTLWSSSILAWFDRWLKDQPEWWGALYPAEE
jgi:dipeptidyl aminopeptidase/acylaminoacyl peptidase